MAIVHRGPKVEDGRSDHANICNRARAGVGRIGIVDFAEAKRGNLVTVFTEALDAKDRSGTKDIASVLDASTLSAQYIQPV